MKGHQSPPSSGSDSLIYCCPPAPTADIWESSPLALECWKTTVETVRLRWAESTTARVDQIAVSFIRYCLLIGVMGWVQHAKVLETAVVLWAAFMARTNSYDSLKTQIQRLRAWFRDRKDSGFPADPTHSALLESFLLGHRRQSGGQPKRKRPITPEMLIAMAKIVLKGRDAETEIVFFAMLIGFFAMLRKSNLTVDSATLLATSKLIRRSDLRVDRESYTLWVRIRRTKTLQYGDREIWIPIQGWLDHPLNVVFWADRVSAIYGSQATQEDHAFAGRWTTDPKPTPLPYRVFLTRLKGLVQAIGLDPTNVAGHSLRRGGASYAFHRGIAPEIIKQLGDWQSDCYLIYCVIPPSRIMAASRQMFDGIAQGDLGGGIWSASRTQR